MKIRPRTIFILAGILIVLLPILWIVSIPSQYARMGENATGEQLFRSAVADPIPASVQILNKDAWFSPGDARYRLHFTISQQDLYPIINAHDFQLHEANYFSDDVKLSWWKPSTLTNYTRYHCRGPYGTIRVMWVSPDYRDVYFEYVKL